MMPLTRTFTWISPRLKTLALGSFLAFVLQAFAVSSPARAQSCSASMTSPITFTGVDPLSTATYDTSGVLSVTCSGYILNPLLGLCFSIGSGTGGVNGSNQRLLAGPGGSTLRFQIFQDATRLVPWGSTSNGLLGGVPIFSLSGNGTTNLPVYFRVYTESQPVNAGAYSSLFTSADATLRYGTILTTILGCNGLGALLTSSTTAPFTMQTTLQPRCILGVSQNVAFGTVANITSNIDAVGVLSVQCTLGTGYKIALSAGNGAGATTALRRMTGPGSTQVTYALFGNAGRTQIWGENLDVDTVGGSGNGSAEAIAVYGRVAPQISPAAGAFTDTVIVTVYY